VAWRTSSRPAGHGDVKGQRHPRVLVDVSAHELGGDQFGIDLAVRERANSSGAGAPAEAVGRFRRVANARSSSTTCGVAAIDGQESRFGPLAFLPLAQRLRAEIAERLCHFFQLGLPGEEAFQFAGSDNRIERAWPSSTDLVSSR